jgi:hypothetical protein
LVIDHRSRTTDAVIAVARAGLLKAGERHRAIETVGASVAVDGPGRHTPAGAVIARRRE